MSYGAGEGAYASSTAVGQVWMRACSSGMACSLTVSASGRRDVVVDEAKGGIMVVRQHVVRHPRCRIMRVAVPVVRPRHRAAEHG